MTLDEMRVYANRSTFHRRRAEAMGWTFRDIDVAVHLHYPGVMLKCDFICVCGRLERFQTHLDTFHMFADPHAAASYLLDPVRLIHEHGAFSREHLLEDGFDPEFVERVVKIEREYKE